MDAIYQRQSVDWRSMNKEKFFSQSFSQDSTYWNVVLENIWPWIEEWDRCCSVPYFHYRQQVSEITSENIRCTGGQLVDSYDLPSDSIFLPIDDDDWFVHNIFDQLRGLISEQTDVIVWNHTILKHDGNLVRLGNEKMFTNNFAITSSGINKLKNSPAYCEHIYRKFPWSEHPQPVVFPTSPIAPHYDLHRRIIKTEFIDPTIIYKPDLLDDFNILRVNRRLNITNKTLASASLLMEMTETQFHRSLRSLSEQKSQGLPWSLNETKRLDEINNNVRTHA
jgi:hypothetical protein